MNIYILYIYPPPSHAPRTGAVAREVLAAPPAPGPADGPKPHGVAVALLVRAASPASPADGPRPLVIKNGAMGNGAIGKHGVRGINDGATGNRQ